MPKADRTRNDRLRRERERRGWSGDDLAGQLRDVAERQGERAIPQVDPTTIYRWERGEQRPTPRYVRLLCAVFDRTAEELGLVDGGSQLRAGADFELVTTSTVDLERSIDPRMHGRLDARQLEDLAILTRLYAHNAQAIAPAVLLPDVLNHLFRLRWLLGGSYPDGIRRRLQMITSEAAIVAGRLAFWRDDRGQAHDHLTMALELATELQEPQLIAFGLAFDADLYSGVPYLGTIGGSTNIALFKFDQAAQLDSPGWPPLLRSWIYGCRSEEHAALGRALDSDRDMEKAHSALAAASGPYGANETVIDIAMLDIAAAAAGLFGFEGAVAIALGRPDDAIAAFEAGLKQASSVGRLSGLAAAYALQGEVELACRLLTEALDTAVQRGLPTRLRRVEGVRMRYLSPFEPSPDVRRFDERLRQAV